MLDVQNTVNSTVNTVTILKFGTGNYGIKSALHGVGKENEMNVQSTQELQSQTTHTRRKHRETDARRIQDTNVDCR